MASLGPDACSVVSSGAGAGSVVCSGAGAGSEVSSVVSSVACSGPDASSEVVSSETSSSAPISPDASSPLLPSIAAISPSSAADNAWSVMFTGSGAVTTRRSVAYSSRDTPRGVTVPNLKGPRNSPPAMAPSARVATIAAPAVARSVLPRALSRTCKPGSSKPRRSPCIAGEGLPGARPILAKGARRVNPEGAKKGVGRCEGVTGVSAPSCHSPLPFSCVGSSAVEG